jgi:ribulose-5-phosphate 4-epimerase/fuculose-1-phosphate aldolase
MRGHGAVVVGASLSQVVGRSIYLELNARLQAQLAALGGVPRYLDADEARLTTAMLRGYDRSWELWRRHAPGG